MIVVDRAVGTVGFIVHGEYREAYKDAKIRTGQLHFACSSGDKGCIFEIVK